MFICHWYCAAIRRLVLSPLKGQDSPVQGQVPVFGLISIMARGILNE